MRHTIKISILVAIAVFMIATPIFAAVQNRSFYNPYEDSNYGFYDPYYSYDDVVYNRGGNFYDRYGNNGRYNVQDNYNKYYDSYYRNYYKNYYENYYKDYYKNYYNNYYKDYYKNKNENPRLTFTPPKQNTTVVSPTPVITWPSEDAVVSKWPEDEPFDEMFGYPPVKKDNKQNSKKSTEIFTFPSIELNNASDFKIENGVGTLNFKASKDNTPKEDSFVFTVGTAENNNPIKTRAITNSLKKLNDTDWKVSFAIPTSLKDDISESNYSLSYSYTDEKSGAKFSGSNAKLSFTK